MSGQLGQTAQHLDDAREELRRLHTHNGTLQQTVKARELELEDLRAAYEDLATEGRHHQSSVGHLKRQIGGYNVELEAAKQEVAHLQVCLGHDAHSCGCVSMRCCVYCDVGAIWILAVPGRPRDLSCACTLTQGIIRLVTSVSTSML